MSDEQQTNGQQQTNEVEGFIVRQEHVGDAPFAGANLTPLMRQTITRLMDIMQRTVNGETGWHAVLSHPDEHYSFRGLVAKLNRRGFNKQGSWEFVQPKEHTSNGEVYKSLWAKYSGTSTGLPLTNDSRTQLHPVDSPAGRVAEAVEQSQQMPDRPHVAPSLGIPIRHNAPQTGTGADPLAGIVFDTPPDAGQTISKGDGTVDEPRRGGSTGEGPQWG